MRHRYEAAKGADRSVPQAMWESRLEAATDPVDRAVTPDADVVAWRRVLETFGAVPSSVPGHAPLGRVRTCASRPRCSTTCASTPSG
jgi:hypothetical protein